MAAAESKMYRTYIISQCKSVGLHIAVEQGGADVQVQKLLGKILLLQEGGSVFAVFSLSVRRAIALLRLLIYMLVLSKYIFKGTPRIMFHQTSGYSMAHLS